MSDELRIEYGVFEIEDVMRFFVKGFEPKGGEIKCHEWYYDPHKGKVVFKLYVKPVASADRPEETKR